MEKKTLLREKESHSDSDFGTLPPVGRGATQVSPWDHLLFELYDDLGEADMQKVMSYYSDDAHIETDDHGPISRQLFSAKINGRSSDQLACAQFLRDVLKGEYLHTVFGESLEKKVDYIEQLDSICLKFEIQPDNISIGRDTDVRNIIEEFKGGSTRAVSICGIGGQGKSWLAREVCCTLQKKNWIVVFMDLRNKVTTEDILKAMLQAVDQKHSISGDQKELMKDMKEFIGRCSTNLIFCLDDCDDAYVRADRKEMLRCKMKFQEFLLELLKIIKLEGPQKIKVRLLLTTREKLMTEDCKKELKKLEADYELKLKTGFIEYELRLLEEEDAVELLKRCSNMYEVEHEEALEIVRKCACSPLAITVVSELLKSRRFTPERLIIHLNIDKKNIPVSKGIGVSKCIERAIDNLDTTHQKALVCLSVFQSSPFNINCARQVVSLHKTEEDDVTEVLQRLHNCHLLDVYINNKSKSNDGKDHKPKNHKTKNQYSLHPLVYQFITGWTKKSKLESVYELAVQKFVDLYENIINDVVKYMDSIYWKGRRKLEKNKTHIMQFYTTLADSSTILKPYPKTLSDKAFVKKKRVSDLADILIPVVKKRRMIQSESERALKGGNNNAYIFWKVEEADAFVMFHDKVEVALEILDKIMKTHHALQNLKSEEVHPSVIHGLFHKVMGLCRWTQLRYKDGLDHLELAVHFFENNDSRSYRLEEAYMSIKSKALLHVGEIYFDLDDLEEADRRFTEGFELVKGMVQPTSAVKVKCMIQPTSDVKESDELQKELHWNIPVFYYKFAVIKIKKAKRQADVSQRDHLLDRAMEDLNKGMQLDERLKLNYFDNYCSKLAAVADIFMLRGELEKALAASERVLERRKEILQIPHINYTLSVFQLAKLYMLMGIECRRQRELAQCHTRWEHSRKYFKELEDHHLKDGSVPLHHPAHEKIKENHVAFVRLTGTGADVEQIKKFYQTLERGGFAKVAKHRINYIKKAMWTPFENFMKYISSTASESDEFGAIDNQVQRFEKMEFDQRMRMLSGESIIESGRSPSSSKSKRETGRSPCSSDMDLTGACCSGSGTLSQRMDHITLLDDNALTESKDVHRTVSVARKPVKKRLKTDL